MYRVEKMYVDTEKCIGCQRCIKACLCDVLRFDEEKKQAYAAYPEECEWCLICQVRCPVDAIVIQPKVPAPSIDVLGLNK